MNLLDMLEDDHEKFRELLETFDKQVLDAPHKFQKAWAPKAKEQTLALLHEFMAQLERHEAIERRLLYPDLIRSGPLGREKVREIENDHHGLDKLLTRFKKELESPAEKEASWILINVLNLVERLPKHMDKEEAELFALARAAIPAAKLDQLGAAARSLQLRTVSL